MIFTIDHSLSSRNWFRVISELNVPYGRRLEIILTYELMNGPIPILLYVVEYRSSYSVCISHQT